MTTLSVRLPDSLHEIARKVAEEDHISLNQFIASAVSEKVSALTTEKYPSHRDGEISVLYNDLRAYLLGRIGYADFRIELLRGFYGGGMCRRWGRLSL